MTFHLINFSISAFSCVCMFVSGCACVGVEEAFLCRHSSSCGRSNSKEQKYFSFLFFTQAQQAEKNNEKEKPE